MKNEQVISIVTPSLNQGKFISDSLDSVISQEGGFYLDYQVIDGGSSDQTLDILKEQERQLRNNHQTKELRGIRFYLPSSAGQGKIRCRGVGFRWLSEPDDGQPDAVNKGISEAVGGVFAFLNSDDTYYPGALRSVCKEDWKGADFLYGEGMWISEDGRDLLLYPTFKPDRYGFFYQCTLCQPAVFMRMESVRQLGMLSTRYQSVFDFEYWMRALFKGKKFRKIDTILAGSRFYPETKTMSGRDLVAEELAGLRSHYYRYDGSLWERLMRLKAMYTVHLPTVKRVNRLHELIGSDVRFKFR